MGKKTLPEKAFTYLTVVQAGIRPELNKNWNIMWTD